LSPSKSLSETKSLLILHHKKYPKARPRDFYKLIFQGVFGVGHILSDKTKDYLVEEAHRVNLNDYPNRELLESVSPDGSIVRIYLRPFMRRNLDLETLYKVILRSADLIGNHKEFFETWRIFRDMVESREILIDKFELDEVQAEMDSEGLKPMHHTDPYREEYYPAYRVVSRDFLIDEFGEL
jgi:hypothetical protein